MLRMGLGETEMTLIYVKTTIHFLQCIVIPQIQYSVRGVRGASGVLQCLLLSHSFCTVSEVSMVPMVSYSVLRHMLLSQFLYSVRGAYGVLQCLMVSVVSHRLLR